MENIYHTHESSNGMQSFWWDSDYYLCETEEEYQKELAKYKARHEAAKIDYAKRGCESYTPTLSKEGEIKANEYYYGHEWHGKTFTAYGFSYHKRDSRCSETTYILKPNSVKGLKHCTDPGIGWMYGS